MSKIGGWLKTKHFGPPSLFDICVILFILIGPALQIGWINRGVHARTLQGLWLIFGTMILMCVGMGLHKRRDYKSLPLCLLTLVAMANMYPHVFRPMFDEALSTAMKIGSAWVTWELMCEGFVYIFFSVFLIRTIVEHAKNWRWYYIPLLFCMIYYICMVGFNMQGLAKVYTDSEGILRETLSGWSMTPLLAICLGVALTLVRIRKTRILACSGLIMGIVVAVSKWPHLMVKWASRPDHWMFTLQRMKLAPWLGNGFYHTVNTKDGLIAAELMGSKEIVDRWGGGLIGGWRHCDILEFGESMGVFAMILASWFFLHLLWKGKSSLAYFMVLTAVIMCIVQRTMFFPIKAATILVMVSVLILETKLGTAEFLSPKRK